MWQCAGRLACALPLLALCASQAQAQAEALPNDTPLPAGEDAPEKDAPKQDAPKQEAPKQEAPKQEAPKQDAVKAPKKDAPKKDAPKKDAVKAAKKDAPKKSSGEALPSVPAEERRPISFGVVGGYGLIIDDAGTEGINPFGVGFGISGGYAIGPVYVGTRFLFFLGQTRGEPDESERSADEFLVGFEVGYTPLRLGPLALRPELGVGLAFSSSEAVSSAPTPEPVDTSSTDPYVDIGIAIELNVSRELFFGVQARAVYVPFKQSERGDHELIGVPLMGSCGMRF